MQMEPLIISLRAVLRNPSSKQQALESCYQMGVSALAEVLSLPYRTFGDWLPMIWTARVVLQRTQAGEQE